MLLLMRRTGEIIRINDKIVLQVKEIRAGSVTFSLQDLSESEADQKKSKTNINTEVKTETRENS